MSLSTINQAANDEELLVRVEAAAWKEAVSNPTFGNTLFGAQVLSGSGPIRSVFGYPIAIDNEAAYESAVVGGNPSPGDDPAVITDGAITAGIQAHWPADTLPAPTP